MKRVTFMGIIVAMIVAPNTGAGPNLDPNANEEGATLWLLFRPGAQEVRLGYQGLLPDIELAVGVLHIDAADPGIEEWPVRGYLIAHAIDAEMLGSLIGNKIVLPDGNLYGGLFGEYTYDRENEWSAGYIVGGLVDWPKGWQTTAEYQATVWNCDDADQWFWLGLRKEF